MEQSIASILPLSFAVALSPMPIAALLLMLLSNRAKINSVMFALGWIVGLAVLVYAVSFLVSSSTTSAASSGFSLKQIIDIALGVLLVFFAIKQWKGRPKKGQAAKIPKWMNAVVSFSPVKAFAVGFLLATINFKNTPVGIAVGTTLSHLSSSGQLIGFIVYLLLASSTILLPTLAFLVFGKSLQGTLNGLKNWLINNNATIMFVLFLIIGVMLISKALGG